MLTFEPFSLDDIGSPQAFQTGETFKNAPIIDYQHPHDLIMQLGAEVTHATDRTRAGAERRRGRHAADRPAAVHASPVGDREPAVAARPSLPRLDARHPRRRHRQRPRRRRSASRPASSRAASPTRCAPTSTWAGSTPSAARVVRARRLVRRRCRAPGSSSPSACRPTTRCRRTASVSHAFRLGGGALSWMAAAGQNREVARQPRGLPARGHVAAGRTLGGLLAGRVRRQGHPRRRLPPGRHRPHAIDSRRSARSRSAPPATCVTGRWGTLGLGARRHRLQRAGEPARGLRVAGVVARVRALPRPRRHLGDDPPPALTPDAVPGTMWHRNTCQRRPQTSVGHGVAWQKL